MGTGMMVDIAEVAKWVDTPPGDFGPLKKANDIAKIYRHTREGTNPRVCDMYTDWGKQQAWDLFWRNGKAGLL